MQFTIDATTHRSKNHEARPAGTAPFILVFHDGEGTAASDLFTLKNNRVPMIKRVSAHYYVTRTGAIFQLVYEELEAWHAGVSAWAGHTNINPISIGVESEHEQGQDWPDIQQQALAWLFRRIIARWHIVQTNVTCHKWISPNRKYDPTDWPDDQMHAWIAALYTPEPPPGPLPILGKYRACGVPVYNEEDCTGPRWGYLSAGDTIAVDKFYGDNERAHLADGRGFVRLDDSLESV